MGQRVRDPQQLGPRHQILVDPLLQRHEEIAHALELPVEVRRSAAERMAAVHHRQDQVVPDVRLQAAQRELQRAYAGMATVRE